MNAEDFIQVIKPGERGYGRYKYRVVDRNGFPTHHTDGYVDARLWAEKCIRHLEKEDE